jgi:glycosyltransferase involved in cell wall biosynthesis
MLPPIYLDATYAVDERPTGVANYSREILDGLACSHPELHLCHCYRPHRFRSGLARPVPPGVRRSLLLDHLLPLRPALFHGLNQRLPKLRMRRAVSTFHDLFVITSQYSTREFRERFTQQARDAAARSDLLVCVSAFTASQVEDLLHVPADRIRVVHHGVRPPQSSLIPAIESRDPLILFVGAIQKRKNVAALVRAFSRVPEPWKLVLVGGRGYGWEEVEIAIAESPARDRISAPGYTGDAALHELYAKASIFAFPSLDEGFGMPVLEAMAWGVPVLSSNRSSMPEVAGDAACLVDPLQQNEIEDALMHLTADLAFRRLLASKGSMRIQAFRWEQAVEQTYAVYKELCG